jgi:hypothetical protein
MGGQEDCSIRTDFLKGFPKDALSTCVLTCGRLIEEEDTWVAYYFMSDLTCKRRTLLTEQSYSY